MEYWKVEAIIITYFVRSDSNCCTTSFQPPFYSHGIVFSFFSLTHVTRVVILTSRLLPQTPYIGRRKTIETET